MKQLIISLTFLVYILNSTAAQYDDPKWQFGGEAGFAWVGFPGQGLQIDIFNTTTRSTYRKNRKGFRTSVSAKYNLNGRVQILGSVGFVYAKGEIKKSSRTDSFLFSGATSSEENIRQKYALLEVPTYFRFYLFNERRSKSKGLNIFLDIGASFKIPIKSDLYFSKSESSGINYEGELQVKSFVGGYSAIGFLIKNKAAMAITSSIIRSQATEYDFIKYWSRLKSVSVTVFF